MSCELVGHMLSSYQEANIVKPPVVHRRSDPIGTALTQKPYSRCLPVFEENRALVVRTSTNLAVTSNAFSARYTRSLLKTVSAPSAVAVNVLSQKCASPPVFCFKQQQ